ncbi:hydrogenase maturation protease [Nonomuraea mesophila]|uniref:hydrogenase maturation protease n=1 Tax=Nonomuraea mesophila TaxID=2530382 RepID=UPI001C707602|nr:hydrogenase maturation protease [Nonomuraea mesophila]
MNDFWTRMAGRGPGEVVVDGTVVGPGSLVRLRPRNRTDVFDLVLGGQVAVVESVEQDDEGALHVAVTLADDPGRDLGEARMPGHRFFYSAEEIEPLGEHEERPGGARVLVAGIGNVFLGDDGFGVEVARHLAAGPPVAGADVVDFGIRGMDLAYALQRAYAGVIFVDAAPRGHAPGTLTVLEPDLPGGPSPDGSLEGPLEGHGMDPVSVLRLARRMGRLPARVRVVCCEPVTVEEALFELSEPVRAMVEAAAGLVKSLVMEMIAENAGPGSRDPLPR